MSIKEKLRNARREESVDLFDHLSSSEKQYEKVIAKIASTLINERRLRGVSQKEFADLLKVSQVMVSKYESGKYNFTIKTAIEAYDKLGLVFETSHRRKNNDYVTEPIKWSGCPEESKTGPMLVGAA